MSARTPRERASLIVAQAALVMLSVLGVLLPRAADRPRQDGLQSTPAQQEEALIRRVFALAPEASGIAADRAERLRRLADQQQQLAQWSEAVAARAMRLQIHGGQLPTLRSAVSELLTRHPGLKLVAMTVGPVDTGTPSPLVRASGPVAAAPNEAAPAAWAMAVSGASRRHDVEITLEGGYLGLMAYVADLEHRLPQARWSSMRASGVAPGVSRLTLTLSVHTGLP